MKKIILGVLLSCGLSLSAQVQSVYPLSVGVKAGASLATSSIDNYTMRGGVAAGIVVDYSFNKNLFVRSGIDFMMKGGKYNQYFEGQNAGVLEKGHKNISIHMNYLQLPLMVGYRSNVGQGVNIYASGGLYGAVSVYGKGRYSYDTNLAGIKNQHYEYTNFDDLQLKKMDFGLVGSIGVEYQHYSVNVGYEYGLVNINKTSNSDKPSAFTGGDSWHNMNATCTLGYKF